MDIKPEYTIGHYRVAKTLIKNLSVHEIDWLTQMLNENFRDGMWRDQQRYSSKWMGQALAKAGCSYEKAGDLLKIDRTSVGRWVNGMVNPPFQQVQRFYVIFGGIDEKDHPFKHRCVLNLGGYMSIMTFVREWLQERQLVEDCEQPSNIPDEVSFVYLYSFYSNVHVEEYFLNNMKLDNGLMALVNGTASDCGVYVEKIDENVLLSILRYWGSAWILCLTLLAEEEAGVSKFKVLVNRPVRLPG